MVLQTKCSHEFRSLSDVSIWGRARRRNAIRSPGNCERVKRTRYREPFSISSPLSSIWSPYHSMIHACLATQLRGLPASFVPSSNSHNLRRVAGLMVMGSTSGRRMKAHEVHRTVGCHVIYSIFFNEKTFGSTYTSLPLSDLGFCVS